VTGEIAYVQRELAEARSNEAFYRDRVVDADATASLRDETASSQRRARILELTLAEYASRGFTRKHPDVIQAQTELAVVRERLKALHVEPEDAEANGEAVETSLAQQLADAEARRAKLRLTGVEEELARLQTLHAEIEDLLMAAPRVAEQLDGLNRLYEHLFTSYQDFSNRKLEATVQAQLERRQLGEQFRVLEQAFPAIEPSSPNRPLIVILGLFFAVVVAAGMGILLEASDASIHTPQQLQTALALPVLGAIPEICLESDRRNQRRCRVRTALATAALVVFALVGGALNYLWVNGSAVLELSTGEGTIEPEVSEVDQDSREPIHPVGAAEAGES